jgi:hypothetical protein
MTKRIRRTKAQILAEKQAEEQKIIDIANRNKALNSAVIDHDNTFKTLNKGSLLCVKSYDKLILPFVKVVVNAYGAKIVTEKDVDMMIDTHKKLRSSKSSGLMNHFGITNMGFETYEGGKTWEKHGGQSENYYDSQLGSFKGYNPVFPGEMLLFMDYLTYNDKSFNDGIFKKQCENETDNDVLACYQSKMAHRIRAIKTSDMSVVILPSIILDIITEL